MLDKTKIKRIALVSLFRGFRIFLINKKSDFLLFRELVPKLRKLAKFDKEIKARKEKLNENINIKDNSNQKSLDMENKNSFIIID